MSTKDYPSVAHIRQCLRYEDGRLFWLGRPRNHFRTDRAWNSWNAAWSNKEAGCLSGEKHKPRWLVRTGGYYLLRYQIVWAIHRDEWCDLIDHENRDQLDDRIVNLRAATHSQNHANSNLQKNNTSGYKGVSWYSSRGKWEAYIKVNGKRLRLGYFDDVLAARDAYVAAAKKHFGEFHFAG